MLQRVGGDEEGGKEREKEQERRETKGTAEQSFWRTRSKVKRTNFLSYFAVLQMHTAHEFLKPAFANIERSDDSRLERFHVKDVALCVLVLHQLPGDREI